MERVEAAGISNNRIRYNQIVRFLRVGRLLHLTALAAVCIAAVSAGNTRQCLAAGEPAGAMIWGILMFCGLGLFWFAQKDAVCRFQNYKQAKDLLYEKQHNVQSRKRIAKLFAVSRCQREAAMVAARDLGLHIELAEYYYRSGYRWYHIIPDSVVRSPLLLLRRSYWKNTLFVPYYCSRHFLW